MTTIPDYLTILAMAHRTHEPRDIRAVRATGRSLRQRVALRFARRANAGVRSSMPAVVLPELRDYPYRSGY